MITIKTPQEIETMAQGGRLLAGIIDRVAKETKAGAATKDLDKLAEFLILECGGQPSFKGPVSEGHGGFPATICVSIDEQVVHGVPSERRILDGDLVALDIGMVYQGFHTDMAVTVAVGEVAPEIMRLMRVTRKALKRGIKKVRPGNTFGDIGNTIERYVDSQGFSIVKDLCGHGIGRSLHEEPQILNYGKRHKGAAIQEGMTFCIEPMVTAGGMEIKKGKDGISYVTKDGSWAAHYEHTLAVTSDGCRILTAVDETLLLKDPDEDDKDDEE